MCSGGTGLGIGSVPPVVEEGRQNVGAQVLGLTRRVLSSESTCRKLSIESEEVLLEGMLEF